MLSPITTTQQLIQSQGAPTGNAIIDAFVAWLKTNKSNLVAEAAKAIGVPQRLLSDTIKFFVGDTAQNVILQWRLRQMLPLLQDTSISYDEVARRCGFKRQKHIEALVKLHFNTTLRAIRTGEARRDFEMSAEERRAQNVNARNLRNTDATS